MPNVEQSMPTSDPQRDVLGFAGLVQEIQGLTPQAAASRIEALRQRQIDREKAQRAAASGKRAKAILAGDMGPVLRRWVSGSIVPVSGRVRHLSTALLGGDLEGASTLAASPVFGLPTLDRSRDLDALLEWTLKADHCDDLVLGVLGTAIAACATSKDGVGVPLTRLLTTCAGIARETALGQFLTEVHGSKAMMRVRKGRRGQAAWQQRKVLDLMAATVAGPERSALDALPNQEEIRVGGREVIYILTPEGERTQRSLRVPERGDWRLLEVARRVKGEKDAHLGTWCGFAMMVLCCAQAEAGWFDLVKMPRRRNVRHRRKAHGIVLSTPAWDAIRGDLDRWLSLGFISEPMIVPPESGDYLTVKHRQVAGGRGPKGLKTDAKGTASWTIAAEVMGATPWAVPERTLEALREVPQVQALAAKAEPDEGRRELILGAYRRLAKEEFYLPLFMDFRGRVYSRSPLVTYQGRDLQKSLMCFPSNRAYVHGASELRARVLHCSALYGNGLDKAALEERHEWFFSKFVNAAVAVGDGLWESALVADLLEAAEEPLQLATALGLHAGPDYLHDSLACQIDGTCNGLQHLSALFRDETAAPWVNLCASTLGDLPADIYAEVAARVARVLDSLGEAWARRIRGAVKIDRKLCKKSVMVLPYGGTRGTIEEAVLEAILDQEPEAALWTHGWIPGQRLGGPAFNDWIEGNYSAFSSRELKDHPLLHLDAKRLGGLVWDAIVEILPKPMAAMQAFRDIAKAVGARSLEWSTGFNYDQLQPLWVVQAKARSDATGLKFKGFHLPGSVRGLRIRPGRDEVDPHAHTTGIVANFIHSQDAAHLARTMRLFQASGGEVPAFGAIHDCYITRPSLMAALGDVTRRAFESQYLQDPLAQGVRLRGVDGVEEYPSWYALAEAYGVAFPEHGSWLPGEVRSSSWFFS